MPHNAIEAEYKDGFVLNEQNQDDKSFYEEGRNTFYDILNKLPETEHGPMVRLSLHVPNKRIDIDWTSVPDNAKPIRFKTYAIERNFATGETSDPMLQKIVFGYEYLDPKTKMNVQKVQEIK